MKCTIPEISWHNREPVLSVDICPVSNDFYKLASSGGDCHVLIWHLTLQDDGAVSIDAISDLTRHQKAVNAVRWSPTGQFLASADDDSNIIIWQLKTDNIPSLDGETNDKETWNVYKILRGHKEDVYDICWSVDGAKLLSGSIDNTAIIWDIGKGKMDHILSDHKGFVQGVAWDPKGQFIATIGTDRMCRIFDTTGKQVKARILKGKLPVPSEHYLHDKEVKYFYDDTFKSFYRRLQFSPDGSILICPSGHIESDDCKKILDATLIFTLDNWSSPAAILPLRKQCSTVIKCCPVLYELREKGPDPVIKLPYRMIIAVATDHDVIVYDTQQMAPCAWLQNLHYARLTDLTWSPDGRLLTASSTDGFCALITFDEYELGIPYVKEDSESEDNPLNISGVEELEEDENIDINNKIEKEEPKPKKSSFLHQWVTTPKNVKPSTNGTTGSAKRLKLDPSINETNSPKATSSPKINKLTPKRILPNQKPQTPIDKFLKKTPSNKTDSDVIIIEDDKPAVQNEKPPINVLIPKRIKPTKVEEKAEISSAQNGSEKPANDKPINILIPRKSKTTQSSTNTTEVQSSSTTNQNINILTPKRIKSAESSTNTINELSSTNKESTDSKPINILTPKKLKSTESTNNMEVDLQSTTNESVDSKPINVLTPKKTKSSESTTNTIEIQSPSTKSKNKINILTPRKTKSVPSNQSSVE